MWKYSHILYLTELVAIMASTKEIAANPQFDKFIQDILRVRPLIHFIKMQYTGDFTLE